MILKAFRKGIFNMNTVTSGTFFLGLCALLVPVADAQLTPTQLTCEYLSNPSVVDVLQPRLAWVNLADPGERGQTQTAWQIRVASSEDKLENPDLWNSEQTRSAVSNRVQYGGTPLSSRAAVLVASPRVGSGRPGVAME